MPDFSNPVQMWSATLGMRTGGTLAVITDMTDDDITEELAAAKLEGREFNFRAVTEQGWPVYIHGEPDNVVLRLIQPHKQYLASGRPNIILQ